MVEIKEENKSRNGRDLYYVAVDVILINEKGEFGLARRCNTEWHNGDYICVGGHKEKGKTIKQTAQNELFEELGIKSKLEDINIFHVMNMNTGKEYIQFFAWVKNWKGDPKVQPELAKGQFVYKADCFDWFKGDNLPQNIVPSSKQAIELYKSGKFYSTIGYDEVDNSK